MLGKVASGLQPFGVPRRLPLRFRISLGLAKLSPAAKGLVLLVNTPGALINVGLAQVR